MKKIKLLLLITAILIALSTINAGNKASNHAAFVTQPVLFFNP